jgi:hypothetical protein
MDMLAGLQFNRFAKTVFRIPSRFMNVSTIEKKSIAANPVFTLAFAFLGMVSP